MGADSGEVTRLLESVDGQVEGYLKRPLPDPLDDVLTQVVDAYLDGDEATRSELLEGLDVRRAQALEVYAERMASLAVRQDSTETLLRGLVAAALAASRLYYKEVLVLLPLFWRSAEHLTIAPEALFATASDLLGDLAPDWFREFPAREPGNRTPEAMGYEERETENGLIYSRGW